MVAANEKAAQVDATQAEKDAAVTAAAAVTTAEEALATAKTAVDTANQALLDAKVADANALLVVVDKTKLYPMPKRAVMQMRLLLPPRNIQLPQLIGQLQQLQ